ncbi:MAG: class I SAM-dependent methyltransferase [Kiritimatiellae bacterium]|nr:class I SAM-dependent methyltransferase [Kiritimatiellia bacterium]
MANEYHKIPEFFEKAVELRKGINSNTYRFFNGIGDGLSGITLDKFDKHYVMQIFNKDLEKRAEYLGIKFLSCIDAQYFIIKLRSSSDGLSLGHTQMIVLKDEPSSSETVVTENGRKFFIDCNDAVNNGLFLDMRDNRKKVTDGLRDGSTMLNCFSYTCSFGVYAATNGCKTVNVDVSRKILDWGKKNYELNGLDDDEHQFVQSDVLEYLDKALAAGEKFSCVVMDPPSFSRNKKSHFSAKDSFYTLIKKSLLLLEPNGTIFVSTNNSALSHDFLHSCLVRAAGDTQRKILAFNKVGQGKDFRGSGKVRESSLCGILAWID